jgi:hypothetical protein
MGEQERFGEAPPVEGILVDKLGAVVTGELADREGAGCIEVLDATQCPAVGLVEESRQPYPSGGHVGNGEGEGGNRRLPKIRLHRRISMVINGVGLTETWGEALGIRVMGTEGNLPEEGMGTGEAPEARGVLGGFQRPIYLAPRYG